MRTVGAPGQVPDATHRFLERVFARTDCRMQVVVAKHQYPFEQRLGMLKDGALDVMVGVSRLPGRELYAHFSVPYRREEIWVLARAEDADLIRVRRFDELMDLGWRVLGPKTGWFGERYEQVRRSGKNLVGDYESLPHASRLLNVKRADLVVVNAMSFRAVPQAQRQAFSVMAEPLHVEELFLAFSKKTIPPELVADVNLALRAELATFDPFAEP